MSGKKWGPDLAALRHRDFALYVSANFLTTIALQIQATALAWQIYAITSEADLREGVQRLNGTPRSERGGSSSSVA